MADIDEYLLTIRDEGKGENVRSAIINAIRAIHADKEYTPSTLKVTQNGTYEATQGNVWNKVIVETDGGDGGSIDYDYIGTIRDNGYYTPEILVDYLGMEPGHAIGGFHVDVDQVTGDLGEITITENGEYDPIKDGWDGYSKVYVNVFGGSGQPGQNCRVRFFDADGRLLQQKSVAWGTDFTCDVVPSAGQFVGWNPSLQRITSDTDFHAVYANSGVAGNVIMDSWETIVTRMQSKNKSIYPPGSYKDILISGGKNTGFGGAKVSYILRMVLVGYERDFTNGGGTAFSTWISNVAVSTAKANAHNANGLFNITPWASKDAWVAARGADLARDLLTPNWGNSLLRAVLNNDKSQLLTSLDIEKYDDTDKMAEIINEGTGYDKMWQSIKPVLKTYGYRKYSDTTYTGYTIAYTDGVSLDKIWVPSRKECSTDTTNYKDFPIEASGTSYIDVLDSIYKSGSNSGGSVLRELVDYASSTTSCPYFGFANNNYALSICAAPATATYNVQIGFCL